MPILTRKTILLSTTTVLLAAAAHAALGGPDGVVIPYAGRLELNGALVGGAVDFQFKVMVNGTTITVCDTKTVVNVPVTRGEFALSIPQVLEACVKGQDVHLIVAVRQDGGAFIELGKQRVTPVLSATTSGAGDFHVAGDFTQGVVNGTGVVLRNGVMKFSNAGIPSQSVTVDHNEVISTAADGVSLSTLFLEGNPVVIGGDGGANPPANRVGRVQVNAPATFERGVAITGGTFTAGTTALGATTISGDLVVTGDVTAPFCKLTAGTRSVAAWCMSEVRGPANQSESILDCQSEAMTICPYAALAACDEINAPRVAFCNNVLDESTFSTAIRMSDISPRSAIGTVPSLLGFLPAGFPGVAPPNSLLDLGPANEARYFCCVARHQ